MAEKLTEAQREVLNAISRGEVRHHNCGHSAWRIFGANPSVVGRLVSMKLAFWPSVCSEDPAKLTEAGRTALALQEDRNG